MKLKVLVAMALSLAMAIDGKAKTKHSISTLGWSETNWTSSLSSGEIYVVPSGMRLIMDSVSGSCVVSRMEELRFVSVASGQEGDWHSDLIPLQVKHWGNSFRLYVGSKAIHHVAGPESRVRFLAAKTGKEKGGKACHMQVAGRLEAIR